MPTHVTHHLDSTSERVRLGRDPARRKAAGTPWALTLKQVEQCRRIAEYGTIFSSHKSDSRSAHVVHFTAAF